MADLSEKFTALRNGGANKRPGSPFLKADAVPAPLPERAENGGPLTDFAAGLFTAQAVKGYTLTHILAAGERGAVFKAHDAVMDRAVVVKAMRPYPNRAGSVEEFFSLAGSIARLRCPGVARGLDAGRAGGAFYLVYECLPGESLAAKMARRQRGNMTEREAVKLVREMAGVLRNLFEAGHPHGHLQPSNVLVAEGGRVFLADIGFAWTMAWPDDPAAFLAKPDFLPPERLAGELNIDIRGDLYSLGSMWFWLLLGRSVFPADHASMVDHPSPADSVPAEFPVTPADGGDGGGAEASPEIPSPFAAILKRRERKAPTARSVDANISEETSKLIQWLLERNRDARPRTPKEFLRRLAAHPLLADAAGGSGDLSEADAAETPPETGEA